MSLNPPTNFLHKTNYLTGLLAFTLYHTWQHKWLVVNWFRFQIPHLWTEKKANSLKLFKPGYVLNMHQNELCCICLIWMIWIINHYQSCIIITESDVVILHIQTVHRKSKYLKSSIFWYGDKNFLIPGTKFCCCQWS